MQPRSLIRGVVTLFLGLLHKESKVGSTRPVEFTTLVLVEVPHHLSRCYKHLSSEWTYVGLDGVKVQLLGELECLRPVTW